MDNVVNFFPFGSENHIRCASNWQVTLHLLHTLPAIPIRKHHLPSFLIQFIQDLFDQYAPRSGGALGLHEVGHHHFHPGVGVDAEAHERVFLDLELIYRGLLYEQLELLDVFGHRGAKLFLGEALDGFLHEFQVAFVSYVERDLVPDVGKFFPGVVEYCRLQHEAVGEADQPAAGKVVGEVVAGEFPEGRVEVVYFYHVAAERVDLDAVAHVEGLADEDVEPADEGGDRVLEREAEDEGDQPEGNGGRIPVLEEEGDGYGSDQQPAQEAHHLGEVVAGVHHARPAQERAFGELGPDEDQRGDKGAKRDLLESGQVITEYLEDVKPQQEIDSEGRQRDDKIAHDPDALVGLCNGCFGCAFRILSLVLDVHGCISYSRCCFASGKPDIQN